LASSFRRNAPCNFNFAPFNLRRCFPNSSWLRCSHLAGDTLAVCPFSRATLCQGHSPPRPT
jgi:hypothetical protein